MNETSPVLASRRTVCWSRPKPSRPVWTFGGHLVKPTGCCTKNESSILSPLSPLNWPLAQTSFAVKLKNRLVFVWRIIKLESTDQLAGIWSPPPPANLLIRLHWCLFAGSISFSQQSLGCEECKNLSQWWVVINHFWTILKRTTLGTLDPLILYPTKATKSGWPDGSEGCLLRFVDPLVSTTPCRCRCSG